TCLCQETRLAQRSNATLGMDNGQLTMANGKSDGRSTMGHGRNTRTRKRAGLDTRARRAAAGLARLVRVMDTLRSPAGCSWDREQTHASLAPFLLEETYEAIDAIDRRDFDALCGELGDVLFQCVFQ